MSTHRYDGKPLTLSIGQSHVVELPPRLIRVRLLGLMFETDKTFLLPKAMAGIRGLVDLYSDHEDLTAVITGHADRAGDTGYNRKLSEARAQAVGQFLYDDVDAWLSRYEAQAVSARWGAREDLHMLGAILDDAGEPFYAGDVDGIFGSQSQDAARRYQSARGLGVDGVPGPQTRRALITDYMALDGTSLPAAADVQYLGCGEEHPAVQTADGVAQEENRRVEVFLFDPGPPDPPVPDQCPGGGCPYETWVGSIAETYDFNHDLGTLVVLCVDEDGEPIDRMGVEVIRETETERTGECDTGGRARFANLLPGGYVVRAGGRGYEPGEESVVIAEGDAFVSLSLRVDWSRFAFELRRSSGDPVHEDESSP